jgi:hypothetical protein
MWHLLSGPNTLLSIRDFYGIDLAELFCLNCLRQRKKCAKLFKLPTIPVDLITCSLCSNCRSKVNRLSSKMLWMFLYQVHIIFAILYYDSIIIEENVLLFDVWMQRKYKHYYTAQFEPNTRDWFIWNTDNWTFPFYNILFTKYNLQSGCLLALAETC